MTTHSLFAALCMPFLVLTACGDAQKLIITRSDPGIVKKGSLLEKEQDSSRCPSPEKVLAGIEYSCADGTKRTGSFLSESLTDCKADGETGCLTTSRFRAADGELAVPGVIKAGLTLAGVTGTLTFQGPGECTKDGEVGCVSTSLFAAVEKSRLTPGVLKSGVNLAGVTGEYPSASFPLAGATSTADLTSLAASTAAGSYEFFDSEGVRHTGSIADAGTVTPGTSSRTFSSSLYRQFTVAGDADLIAGKILLGENIFGVTGNVTLPSSTAVVFGTNYGAAGTQVSGGYSPDFPDAANVRTTDTVGGVAGTLATCTSQSQTGCAVDSPYIARIPSGDILLETFSASPVGPQYFTQKAWDGSWAAVDFATNCPSSGGKWSVVLSASVNMCQFYMTTFDLWNGYVATDVTNVTQVADIGFALGLAHRTSSISTNPRHSYEFIIYGGNLQAQYKTFDASNANTVHSALGATPYNAVNHKHLRITHKESTDTMVFDISSDGLTWTQFASMPRNAAFNPRFAMPETTLWKTGANGGTLNMDNLRVGSNR